MVSCIIFSDGFFCCFPFFFLFAKKKNFMIDITAAHKPFHSASCMYKIKKCLWWFIVLVAVILQCRLPL